MKSAFSEEERQLILNVKQKIGNKIWTSDTPVLYYQDVFLSGGAVCSLFHGEEPKDWDMYFIDEGKQKKFVENLLADYDDSIADVTENYKETFGTDGKMITANAITLKDGRSFITKWVGTPSEIRKNFDYVHCLPYYYKGKMYISKQQFDAIMKKKLIVNDPTSLKGFRKQKFLERGFTE